MSVGGGGGAAGAGGGESPGRAGVRVHPTAVPCGPPVTGTPFVTGALGAIDTDVASTVDHTRTNRKPPAAHVPFGVAVKVRIRGPSTGGGVTGGPTGGGTTGGVVTGARLVVGASSGTSTAGGTVVVVETEVSERRTVVSTSVAMVATSVSPSSPCRATRPPTNRTKAATASATTRSRREPDRVAATSLGPSPRSDRPGPWRWAGRARPTRPRRRRTRSGARSWSGP